MRATILAMGLALLCSPALAQTVTLAGLDGQTGTLSSADIAALPQIKLTLDVHGETHAYEGPLLSDVVAKVGAPVGKALHGEALADVVIVKGADGYQVAFGLGETDPAIRPNRIILADRVDGHALDAKEGPFRIVVEGDLKPMRSARMVVSIGVVKLVAGKP
jgi:hypothetical protein